ncbi:MAG: S41 family peptidase [Pseudomonadota bacterium]
MRRFFPASIIALILLTISTVSFAQKKEIYDLLDLFGSVFQIVRSDYVEEVKDSEVIEAAINGMLASLDPHSSYLNQKSFGEMQVQTKGEFGGLGIEVTMENGLIKVVLPIDDTPAFKAGIRAGDYISGINDEPVMGITLSEAVDKMRGAPDTKIKITVLREGESEPLNFNIVRAIIKIKSVRSHATGDIVYLRITQFNENTIDKLKEEWEKQKKAIAQNDNAQVKGIVLDLRNNPGGLLDQAVAVSDAFLDGGEIVSTRGRDPENTKRYTAHGNNIAKGIPIVVLINNGSASASEIVAGALQDHKRAIIMGIKSFGKGSVQTVIPLPGHGAMKLTTARYFTPSGHSIQAKGITPDILVEQAKIQQLKKPAQQRLEASLPRRLLGEDELKKSKNKTENKVEEVVKKETPKEDKKDTKKSSKPDEVTDRDIDGNISESEDFQLARAIDLLKSLAVYKSM